MARSSFKMKGMSFKEDQAPLKTINLSKIASKIKSSKFGESKLGKGVGNLVEKGGKMQEKFVKGKRKLGLKTPGYDATMSSEEKENFFAPKAELKDISRTTDALGEEINLEKVKVGPREDGSGLKKKSPTRKYKKKK